MRIEEAWFESDRGRCAGTWYWPDNADARSACVVLANGFSGTRDWILPDFASRFAAAGFAAFAFDYRHLGESDGTPRQIVDVKKQRADVRAALTYVRREPRVDATRVVLWGTSLGGSHALTIAAEDPELAAIILNMPALDVLAGANVRAKLERTGASPSRAVATTIRLMLTALRDRLGSVRGRPPIYLDVYGRSGKAFFTDPELAPLFKRVAESSHTWQNRVAARFLLGAPRYREGTFERVAAPILICLAEHDLEVAGTFVRAKAGGAPRVEIREYPVGHFELYHGAAFEQVAADQVSFIRAHVS